MQSAKEKLSNMASAAKEHVVMCKAQMEEKAEKAAARTEEERVIAHEHRKAKEAEAKMELHEAKARHAADKLSAKQSSLYGPEHGREAPVVGMGHHHHQVYGHNQPVVGSMTSQQPIGAAAPMVGEAVPTYPPGGQHMQGQQPMGTAVPTAGSTAPAYPLGGQRPGHKFL